MQETIAIDDPGVCQSDITSVTQAGCTKMAERIDVQFEVETPVDPRNIASDGGSQRFDAAFAKLL